MFSHPPLCFLTHNIRSLIIFTSFLVNDMRYAREEHAPPSDRTRLRRFHERGRYDRCAINDILDAGVLCHVAFVQAGQPFCIPTLYWRDGDRVYFHGSAASRMMETAEDSPICLTVTHLDGLVLARSAFHHSANYRSVVVFGTPERVAEPAEVVRQMRLMMDRIFPGRWDRLRPVRAQELKATRLLSLSLSEASAKIRGGTVDEDEDDSDWPVWAGVVPIQARAEAACPDQYAAKMGLAPPAVTLFGG